MALTTEEAAHLAKLARIDLSDEELSKIAPQLDQILEYVAIVKEVDLTDVEPTSHAIAVENVFRDDEVKPSYDPEVLLSQAPAAEDGKFRVPRILAEEA